MDITTKYELNQYVWLINGYNIVKAKIVKITITIYEGAIYKTYDVKLKDGYEINDIPEICLFETKENIVEYLLNKLK